MGAPPRRGERDGCMRSRNGASVWVRIAWGILLGAAIQAQGASALTVGPLDVDPVYYKPGGGFGFATPEPVDVIASTAASAWKTTSGAGAAVSISINLQTPVWQNPQGGSPP